MKSEMDINTELQQIDKELDRIAGEMENSVDLNTIQQYHEVKVALINTRNSLLWVIGESPDENGELLVTIDTENAY